MVNGGLPCHLNYFSHCFLPFVKWYDVDVFYGNDEVRNVHLSGDMVRYKEIQNLLYFFEQISDVKFEIKGRTIVVNYK